MSYLYSKLPFFISTDQQSYENQGIGFQFMPHLVEEASMMMHNLISHSKFVHGDFVKSYFLLKAVN